MNKKKGLFVFLMICCSLFVFVSCNNLRENDGVNNDVLNNIDTEMYIGINTLAPSEGLEYTLNVDEKSYSIVGIGSCRDRIVVIPSTHNDLPITCIGDEAFSNCQSIDEIVFDENNMITSIGSSAFYDSSITRIRIPKGVTTIGSHAFYNSMIEKIEVPDSIISIGDYAFGYSDNGGSFYSYSLGIDYNLFDNAMYLGNDENPFVVCIGLNDKSVTSCEIYRETKIIYENAFANSNLINIVIPDEVKSIGDGAFVGCIDLKSISIPDSIVTIGDYAFDDCSEELNYEFYENAYYLGNDTNPYVVLIKAKDTSISSCKINCMTKVVYYAAFDECKNLTNIIFEESSQLKSIGSYAFCDIGRVDNIILPNSVVNIGDEVFYLCKKLVIPKSIANIGENAFIRIKTIYYTGSEMDWRQINIDNYSANLDSVTIIYNYVP